MSSIYSELDHQSLQSDSEEEEEDLISLQIGTNTVYVLYSLLGKYSKLIREKYLISDIKNHLPQDIQRFQHESDLKEENIISYLQYFKNSQISITNDNYRDFYKLSEFFQTGKLLKTLNKYASSHNNDIDFIIQIVLEEISTMNDTTKYNLSDKMQIILSENVNDCLQNKKFEKLPISIVYSILSKANKSTIKSDFLFDFINHSKSERYVLFTFLDLKCLSDNKFNILYQDYINCKDDSCSGYFQYLPCSLTYINYLKKSKEELQEKK